MSELSGIDTYLLDGSDGPEAGDCAHACACKGCPEHRGPCAETVRHESIEVDSDQSTWRRIAYRIVDCAEKPYCDDCRHALRQVRKSKRRHQRRHMEQH